MMLQFASKKNVFEQKDVKNRASETKLLKFAHGTKHAILMCGSHVRADKTVVP